MLGKAGSVQIYHGLICDKRTWIRYNYQTIVVENNIIVKTPKIHSCLFKRDETFVPLFLLVFYSRASFQSLRCTVTYGSSPGSLQFKL